MVMNTIEDDDDDDDGKTTTTIPSARRSVAPRCDLGATQSRWRFELAEHCAFGEGPDDARRFKFNGSVYELEDASFSFASPAWIIYNNSVAREVAPREPVMRREPRCEDAENVWAVLKRPNTGGRFANSINVTGATALCAAFFWNRELT